MASGNQAIVSAVDEREALTSRTIPKMTLSTSSNPLTAALAHASAQTSHEDRARARFEVPGTAILTGGTGNVAMAAAHALFEHGTESIALLDLPAAFESSEAAISALRARFPTKSLHWISCDVTSQTSVEQAVAQAAIVMGGVTTLCCFAGIVNSVHATETSAEAFRRVMDVNLTGSFLVAQAVAKQMIRQNQEILASNLSAPIPGYSILFTASISAHATNFPQPQVAYNASKTALLSTTKSLAAEWAVHGIRVNSISPGYLDTILNAGDGLADFRPQWAARCPMGRMGDVEEVTGAVIFLSSPRAGRYITGTDIVVDGGATVF